MHLGNASNYFFCMYSNIRRIKEINVIKKVKKAIVFLALLISFKKESTT